MPPIRTPSLVLNTFPYGDSSKILRLLTPGYGLRSVIAKGARRPGSRFGAVLEPFAEGEAQFNLREGQELFTLTGFSLARSRQSLGRDLAAFTAASLLAEIVLRVGTEEAQPELFHFITESLNRLADPRHPAVDTAISALWRLVAMLGFRPEMESCVRCSSTLGVSEAAAFDVGAGGVVCLHCRPDVRGIDSALRQDVIRICDGNEPVSPLMDPRAHGLLLSDFLGTHLAADRPLRALALFREQLR